jgi:hypothetical protein
MANKVASYITPVKCIHSSQDLESFNKSSLQQEILRFVQACAEAVVDVPNSSENIHISPILQRFVAFMEELYQLVESTPPIKQPMRFGNKAFRTWHERLPSYIHSFLQDILPTDESAVEIELTPYLADMFGNATRIDYGTGHELNFVLFFVCLHKLNLIHENDLAAVVVKGFVAYIKTMRKLQLDYMLEPAGSHGVWGLDDYHCLVFFWGAAQLSKHQDIRPSSIHDPEIIREFADDYIYLEGISFIKQIKLGAPFAETSPMLNDISNIPEWARICSGLLRLFQAEVLGKLPVIQHLVFGNLLPCTWKNSAVESAETSSIQSASSSGHLGVTTGMPGRGSVSQQHHSHHHPHSQLPYAATGRPSSGASTLLTSVSTMMPTTVRPINISSVQGTNTSEHNNADANANSKNLPQK